MNDSILKKKTANYNKVLDLLSQIEITLMSDYAPAQITDKVYILRCVLEHELRLMSYDLIEEQSNNDFIERNVKARK